MSSKEETTAAVGTKLLALSAAFGASQLVELTVVVEFITKVVIMLSAIVYLFLLCWKNWWRAIATDRGWLDKYPSLRRNTPTFDPKETEPAPLPELPKR